MLDTFKPDQLITHRLIRGQPARSDGTFLLSATGAAGHDAEVEMPDKLKIRLLGGFEIVLDGRRVDGFQSLRLQRFLALLTLRDGAQHRSRLAFELWPDSSESQARTNLRKLLHEFRQALPDSDLFADTDSEQLRWRDTAPASVDVMHFRAAISSSDFQEAAAIYGGDLLPACYDDWVLEARSSLRRDAQTAFTRAAVAAAELDEHEAVLEHARRLEELEPTDEAAICHQIKAYRALGDRNAAMRAYHRYAEVVERDLGVTPDEAVRNLYQEVRDEFAPSEDTEAVDTAPPEQGPAVIAPFVGREGDIAALQSAWSAAQSKTARLVLLTGEPGIGKSRLAQEMGRHIAAHGHTVITARAYEAAGRLPWGPVVDLLRSDTIRERIDALEQVWQTELSRLLPELASRPGTPPRAGTGDPVQRHRLFDAVSRALVSRDRPCLIVIDDLQWCDTETIDMIGYLIRANASAPLLIVGTVRPQEVPEGHPLTRLTDALERDAVVTALPLERLDITATAALAARMRGVESVDSDFAARLWTATTGNPLFLVETLRAGASEGQTFELTPTVRAVIRTRLTRLSEGARRVAEMAAVIGRAFTLDLIGAASSTDERTLIEAIDELWQCRIIAEQGVRYDFSHDKLREVALEMISPARRRLLHRAAAGALLAVHGSDPAAISPQLAAHYTRAGMIEQAIGAYRKAGAGAVAVSAFEEAVDHFRRALTLLPELPRSSSRDRLELDIRIALGSPLVALEGYGAERAHQLYERAMALCRKLGDPVDAPILRGLGLARLQGCRFADCDQMGSALAESSDPVAVTEGRYLLGVSAFWQGELARSRTCLESAIANYAPSHTSEHLTRFAQDPKAVCMVRLALTEFWQGDPRRAEKTARAAQALAKDIGQLMTLGYVITYAAIGAAEAEDLNRLIQLLADAEKLRKRFSMRYLSVVLESLQGWVDLCDGDRRGIKRIAQSVKRSRNEGENLHLTYMLLLLARAHERWGDAALARAEVAESLSLTAAHGQFYLHSELRRMEGNLALANGETDTARAALTGAISIARDQGALWSELKARTSFALGFPGEGAIPGLHALMTRIPSGQDLPAFRAAASVTGSGK
ncbi:AAA family ATPase [Leisingera sp. JC11]|uniref:ATP-binding protein n=1 Tax=Leisingera sp. JC11 TaxID=3042469 RepID=UPI0034573333